MLWLVLEWIDPRLRRPGLADAWPLPPDASIRVGSRRWDTIRIARHADALLGGHTSYVLHRRGDEPGMRVMHMGHVGTARIAGEEESPPARPLVVGEALEIDTVSGALGLVLRLRERAPAPA